MTYYPGFNNNSSNSNNLSKNSSLFPARVKDVSLSPQSDMFDEAQGWAGIGTIKFVPLYKNIDQSKNTSIILAKPLFSNIKQYPLIGELVTILVGPSYDLNDNPNASDYYYIPLPIALWNSNHHNAFPDIISFDNNPSPLNFGESFKENKNIRNLTPEEGDVIIEGRYGNSIRFSNTTSNQNTNPWSSGGNVGDPLMIIRNGQLINNSDPSWIPSYEDINGDDSSIYLCSGQNIPLELASKNLKSFNVTVGNYFNPSLPVIKDEGTSPQQLDNL